MCSTPRSRRHTFLSTPSARRATVTFCRKRQQSRKFLSTPSARRATDACVVYDCVHEISIHALREEGDPLLFAEKAVRLYFYPRPPRGGRPKKAENSSTV